MSEHAAPASSFTTHRFYGGHIADGVFIPPVTFTINYNADNESITVGMALCSEMDNFSREKGKDLSSLDNKAKQDRIVTAKYRPDLTMLENCTAALMDAVFPVIDDIEIDIHHRNTPQHYFAQVLSRIMLISYFKHRLVPTHMLSSTEEALDNHGYGLRFNNSAHIQFITNGLDSYTSKVASSLDLLDAEGEIGMGEDPFGYNSGEEFVAEAFSM